MKAYRVNLIGSNDHYLITEKQKNAVQDAVDNKTSRYIYFGGDMIMASSVKSIVATNVDLESCPDYFQQAVERERAGKPADPNAGLRKLPTEWIVLDTEGNILATDVSHSTITTVTKMVLEKGDPEADKSRRFMVAKCHYKTESDGNRSYFTGLGQMPEALRCFPNAGNPGHMIVRQIYKYGKPTLALN